MYLFGWINEFWDMGPLKLLSGPRYRIKLLSLVFLWPLRYTEPNREGFIHVSFRLNKPFSGAPLKLLSGPRYRIKLLSLVFLWPLMYNDPNGGSFIHVSFRLNKCIFWPLILCPQGHWYRMCPGSNTDYWFLGPNGHDLTLKPCVSFRLIKSSGLLV